MTTYVALLRGVNVGRHGRMAMAELRILCAGIGLRDVRTYVQSGNVVFATDRADLDVIGAELAEAVSAELGVSIAVLVRSAGELTAVVAANPYREAAETDPTKVHVAFLSVELTDGEWDALNVDGYLPERACRGDRVVYLHLPGGVGRSRLAADVAKRFAAARPTLRNWRTVTALLEMARD